MSVSVWQPGKLYQPGALVTPATAPPVVSSALTNGTFEDGDTGWTKGTGWVIQIDPRHYDGSWSGVFGSVTGAAFLTNDNAVPVVPGQTISATAAVNVTSGSPAQLGASIKIQWLDSLSAFISEADSGLITSAGGSFRIVTVSGTAPAGAAFAQFVVSAYKNSGPNFIVVDACSWDYVSSGAPTNLLFKAVQADAGFSANSEPTWPTVLGNTVVDNEVTWEAIQATEVTWEATPIMKSGSVEPDFPPTVGGSVADNSKISWIAATRQVTDSKCPQSKVVAIGASKIFAGATDIMSFSATINPLDWSTADDAGYLNFGLQTNGSQPISATGLYRGNLVIFNSRSFQMWQIDQDPANMALLDSVPIGCTFHRTPQSVANDLIFLNSKGVRNIGVAGPSNNLRANGVGEPIDSLVGASIKAQQYEPFGLYWPAMGQYWVVFGPQAFVLSINGASKKSWSRYVFPNPLTDWTLDGNDLILRAADESGDLIWRMDATAPCDDMRNLTFFTAATSGTHRGYVSGSLGTRNSTDLTHRNIIEAMWNGTSHVFTFELTSIFNDTLLPEAIRVWDGSDPTTMTLIREYLVSDAASVSFPGGASSPVSIDWDETTNILASSTNFIIEIVALPQIPVSSDEFGSSDGLFEAFESIVQWPHLDMGAPGVNKTLIGLDMVSTAPRGVEVSIGYNQKDLTQRTTPYAIEDDTVPGQLIPIPVGAPSFDLQLTFPADQIWEWQMANLYIQDLRMTS